MGAAVDAAAPAAVGGVREDIWPASTRCLMTVGEEMVCVVVVKAAMSIAVV